MTDSRLEAVRHEIAELDRSIARAVTRRLALAREVGEQKKIHHAPTRDFEVEAQVLGRWRAELSSAGVTSARADALARWFIEEAVRVQQDSWGTIASRTSEPNDIAIVGGAGAMGRWLTRFFEDAGHRVAIVDPTATEGDGARYPDIESAASQVNVLVFATPIRSTAPLLRRALATETRALILDVLSVKAPIAELLKSAAEAGRRVSSLHPLFGPSALSLSGRNLLIVSCGVTEADREARSLFERSAVTITEVTIDRHDLLIAESLGLAHAVNLLFLAALSTDPATPHELAVAASTTFNGQTALARTVAREGAELYLDIQALNPHSWAVYEELRAAMDKLSGIVNRRDLDSFAKLLRSGEAKLESAAGLL